MSVKVVSGGNVAKIREGKNVAEIRETFAGGFGIEPTSVATINGELAREFDVPLDGEKVAFQVPLGQKG